MALLTLQDASGGLDEVIFEAADTDGDQVPSGSRAGGWSLGVVLLARNGGASTDPAHDVTVSGVTVTVPPEGAVAVVPVPGFVAFGSPADVTYSDVTALDVAAVRL